MDTDAVMVPTSDGDRSYYDSDTPILDKLTAHEADTRISQAYSEGRRYFMQYISRVAKTGDSEDKGLGNPYRFPDWGMHNPLFDSKLSSAWIQGHNDAEEEYNEKRDREEAKKHGFEHA